MGELQMLSLGQGSTSMIKVSLNWCFPESAVLPYPGHTAVKGISTTNHQHRQYGHERNQTFTPLIALILGI